VVCGDDVYGGTFRILDKVMKPMGITATFVDMTDLARPRDAIRPNTRLVWLETPTNPMLKVFDIEASRHREGARRGPRRRQHVRHARASAPARARRHRRGALDHEVPQRPLGRRRRRRDDERREPRRALRFLQNAIGAVPSPFDCYMVLRGLKTLGVRVRAPRAAR
jgi:cystathionine beta-lyase/cystathionine gamma-synthase